MVDLTTGVVGAINSAASGNIYINNFNKALQGADGGAPGMFTIKYAADGGFWGRINGGSQERSSGAVVGGVQSKTGPRLYDWSQEMTVQVPTIWQLVNLLSSMM